MNKNHTKRELAKITNSFSIPPAEKKALLDGVRETVKEIEKAYGKCAYDIKYSVERDGTPVVKISARRVN